MNEKNLPDDIASKSLNELTDLADEIIKNLENRNNLENTSEDYANLLIFIKFEYSSDVFSRLFSSSKFLMISSAKSVSSFRDFDAISSSKFFSFIY